MKIGTLRDGTRNLPALIHGERAYRLDDVLGAMGGVPVVIPDGADAATILATPALAAAARSAMDALPDLITRGAAPSSPLYVLGPPVPRPGKIVCAGRNYADHAKELGNDVPTRPILFAKLATSVRGPFEDVVRPREVDDLDYEAELCVVIGTGGRRIPQERALAHVAGYCCANDVSARNAQLGLGDQWLRGKSFDTFCPIGPWIVTADEIPDPQALNVRCRVDGILRQDGRTADMIFDVTTLISYISDAFTLEPGDLILTGTPSGVAMGQQPAPWLQPGQLCEVEIPGIGTIANRIVAEQPARYD
ncbi:MAG TPA: fumarylacetoacetate hydrolase family protein [Candidatus Saccharimonadales bacterium]|nr:fumarylacetoacetate hydrolase family protein [Candidatus Saccharimonadales bacterium]